MGIQNIVSSGKLKENNRVGELSVVISKLVFKEAERNDFYQINTVQDTIQLTALVNTAKKLQALRRLENFVTC